MPLTHSAVVAARVPHGGLRVVMVVRGRCGQVSVGQCHRILLLVVPGRQHGRAVFRTAATAGSLQRFFDGHFLAAAATGSFAAVQRLHEIRHSGSQSAIVRVV